MRASTRSPLAGGSPYQGPNQSSSKGQCMACCHTCSWVYRDDQLALHLTSNPNIKNDSRVLSDRIAPSLRLKASQRRRGDWKNRRGRGDCGLGFHRRSRQLQGRRLPHVHTKEPLEGKYLKYMITSHNGNVNAANWAEGVVNRRDYHGDVRPTQT